MTQRSKITHNVEISKFPIQKFPVGQLQRQKEERYTVIMVMCQENSTEYQYDRL